MWTRSADISASLACSSARSGEPGCVALDRLVDRRRRPEDAGGAHDGDCILDGVRVTRHPYEVPGWGVGEVWAREGTIVQHELACEELRRAHEREAEASAAFVLLDARSGPGDVGATTSVSPNGGARLPARTLPAESSRVCDESVADLCRRIAAHLAGVPTSYADVTIDLEWTTPLQRELAAAAHARSRGARSSRTASSQPSPDVRERRGPQGRSAPRTGSR